MNHTSPTIATETARRLRFTPQATLPRHSPLAANPGAKGSCIPATQGTAPKGRCGKAATRDTLITNGHERDKRDTP
jgi:hypothetical protein